MISQAEFPKAIREPRRGSMLREILVAPNLRCRARWSVLVGMLDDFVFEDGEWSYDRRGRDQETPGGANNT